MAEQAEMLAGIELLAKNEEIIADLYALYGQCYPELCEFWNDLSREEVAHAVWVRSIIAKLNAHQMTLQENRFAPEGYQLFYRFVSQRFEEAGENPPDVFVALTVARDLEKTLIEQSFLVIFDTDDPDLQRVLRILTESTEEHRLRIDQVWEDYRRKHAVR